MPTVRDQCRMIRRAVGRQAEPQGGSGIADAEQSEDDEFQGSSAPAHFDPQAGHELLPDGWACSRARRWLGRRASVQAARPWLRRLPLGESRIGALLGARSVMENRHSGERKERNAEGDREDAAEQHAATEVDEAAVELGLASSSASVSRSAPVPSGSNLANVSRYSSFWPTMLDVTR